MRQNRKQKKEIRAQMAGHPGENYTTTRRRVLAGELEAALELVPAVCPVCEVLEGHQHVEGCQVERCQTCGLQRLACGHRPASRLPWTGQWPGEAECIEYGWFAKLVTGQGWVRCSPEDHDACPDLNRLYAEARWDSRENRWVLE